MRNLIKTTFIAMILLWTGNALAQRIETEAIIISNNLTVAGPGSLYIGAIKALSESNGLVVSTYPLYNVDTNGVTNSYILSPTNAWTDGKVLSSTDNGRTTYAMNPLSIPLNMDLNANGFSITNESVVLVNPPEIPYSSSVTVSVSRGDTQLYKPTGVTTITLDNSVVTNAVVAGISLQLVAFTNSITFSTNNLIFTTNRVPGAGVADFLSTLYTNAGQASIILFNKPYNTTNWHVWSLQ